MEAGKPALEGTLGRPAMARTLGWFYVAGATLGGLSLVLPHSDTTNLLAMAIVIACAFAGGGFLFLGATRLPEDAVPIFLILGSGLITAAVYFDGHTSSVYSFFYVWVGVAAFSSSTIASGITPRTRPSRRSRSTSSSGSAGSTWRHGWAARSSPCSCPTRTSAAPSWSPSACAALSIAPSPRRRCR